ncbi:hypothetical protein T261_2566 [Streptomyces lydicus]|nr:hypothetical protein T261_2566 [Streptomyces lydicus]
MQRSSGVLGGVFRAECSRSVPRGVAERPGDCSRAPLLRLLL